MRGAPGPESIPADTHAVKGRAEIVLAAMASGGAGASFDAMRVQKLLFLVDAEIPDLTGGPHFRFRPGNYGPFDAGVYAALDELAGRSLVIVGERNGYRDYSLTPDGYAAGRTLLAGLPEEARRFIGSAVNWLRLSTFRRILNFIRRRYPEMSANAIIPELRTPPMRAAHRFTPPSFLSGVARLLDFTGSLDPPLYAGPPDQADAMAMRQDREQNWEAVGDDMESVLAQLGPPGPVR